MFVVNTNEKAHYRKLNTKVTAATMTRTKITITLTIAPTTKQTITSKGEKNNTPKVGQKKEKKTTTEHLTKPGLVPMTTIMTNDNENSKGNIVTTQTTRT